MVFIYSEKVRILLFTAGLRIEDLCTFVIRSYEKSVIYWN